MSEITTSLKAKMKGGKGKKERKTVQKGRMDSERREISMEEIILLV